MNNNNAKIFEALQKMAVLFDGRVSEERLIGYTNFLTAYTPDEITQALREIVLTCDRFPTIKQIRSILEPELDSNQMAIDIAGTIISCISRFGIPWGEDAKKAIGEIGWQAVESYGGWTELCKISNDEVGIANAQLRELCKVKLQRKKMETRENYKAARLESNNDTKHIGDIFNNVDFRG